MLTTKQATGLPELAMGQNSSQVAESSVDGYDGELEPLKICYSRLLKSNLTTEEEIVNGTPDTPIDWQELPSQRSLVAHTDSEQAFDKEKTRKRKRSKKREGARTVDPELHSKVEQSARTLLEMKGAHELERAYGNEDDRAASSQILSETLVQASPELPENFGTGSALEAQKPRKARREKKSRRPEKRKAADSDAADLAMMLVEDEPSGTNGDLVPSTHIYPDPHIQQYQYEPTSPIDSDVTLGRGVVASISANSKYLPDTGEHTDSNHTIEPLGCSSHNAQFASVRSPAPKIASQSKNAEKKRKSKSSYIASSPPQSAASLAVAANAANALIDPALTAHQGDIWVIPDSQADHTPGNNTQDSIETSTSTQQRTTKRKRRLPDVNGYQADSSKPLKKVKSSDGLKKSVAKEKAKMNPSGMKDSSTLGPFDDVEISLLADFMEKYRDYHDLSEHQLNEKVHMTGRGGGPKDGFWDDVSDVLPYRTRQSIMKVCRRRFHNYDKRGKWTPDEDELLEQAQNEKPNKWKEIGETIGRLPEDCRDRWRNYLKCGDKRKTDIWTEKEVIMLKDAVAECRESMRSAKAKQAKTPTIKEGFGSFSVGPTEEDDEDNDVDLINWSVVSEKMGNIRSRLQCLYKWKKLKQNEELEIEKRQKEAEEDDHFSDPDHPVKPAKITWRTKRAKANFAKMLPGDKLEILRALAESSTYEEKNIPWRLLSSQAWRGQWSTVDRKEAFAQMKNCIPGHERFSLQELVQMLIEIIEELEPSDRHDLFYVAPEPPQEAGTGSRKKRRRKQQSKEIERNVDDAMAAVNGGWLHPSRVTANSQARRPQHTASNSPVDEVMVQQMQLLQQA
ncbi:MAG: RNA polymerase I enhancer binding protein [Candelina submexicana]|nr:MAG: RNA polymerase I enhancer binding protein [Candelina submexicana]